MKAVYKFKNLLPKKNMSIVIDLFDKDNNKILTAAQFGFKIPLNSISLLKKLFLNPLITIKVIFAILYESIFIVIKGGKYYSRQKKIKDSISFEGDL